MMHVSRGIWHEVRAQKWLLKKKMRSEEVATKVQTYDFF